MAEDKQVHEFNEQDVCKHCGEALGYAGATGSTHCGDLEEPVVDHKPFITVTKGMAWFAVMYWWNPDMGGFWEPWETGVGRYVDEARAVEEAQIWAENECLEYKPRKKKPTE